MARENRFSQIWRWVKKQVPGARSRVSRQTGRSWQEVPLAARRAAAVWWLARDRRLARCDVCCRPLRWGEGYLLESWQVSAGRLAEELWPEDDESAWLVCEACFEEI